MVEILVGIVLGGLSGAKAKEICDDVACNYSFRKLRLRQESAERLGVVVGWVGAAASMASSLALSIFDWGF